MGLGLPSQLPAASVAGLPKGFPQNSASLPQNNTVLPPNMILKNPPPASALPFATVPDLVVNQLLLALNNPTAAKTTLNTMNAPLLQGFMGLAAGNVLPQTHQQALQQQTSSGPKLSAQQQQQLPVTAAGLPNLLSALASVVNPTQQVQLQQPMMNPMVLLHTLGLGNLAQQLNAMNQRKGNEKVALPPRTNTNSSSSINAAISTFPLAKLKDPPPSAAHGTITSTSQEEDQCSSSKEAATAASSADSKEDGSGGGTDRLPKTIILPCRARGMPLDHNFRSAHFVIPQNVRHGEDLVCSYEACRKAGSKFRYCAECRIPVAKRNFHQRHGHGLACAPVSESKPVASVTTAASQACRPVPKNTKAEASKDLAAALKLAKMQSHPKKRKQLGRSESGTDSSSTGVSQSAQKRRKERYARAASSSDRGPFYPALDDIPPVRQLRWATLLGKRPDPDDADGMSAWLLEVMTVSDLKAPLGQFVSSSLTGSGESNAFGSNSDSAEMGLSVNSSLSIDVLTSDVSSEGAVQDCLDTPMGKEDVVVSKVDYKLSQKSDQGRRKKERHAAQKESKKDAIKAVRRQEKKRKAQKGRDDKEKRKSKKKQRSSENKKAKTSSSTSAVALKSAGLSESQVKMVQVENAKARQEELSNDSPDNEDLSRSYAEWQVRKKQKALARNEAAASFAVASAAPAENSLVSSAPVASDAQK